MYGVPWILKNPTNPRIWSHIRFWALLNFRNFLWLFLHQRNYDTSLGSRDITMGIFLWRGGGVQRNWVFFIVFEKNILWCKNLESAFAWPGPGRQTKPAEKDVKVQIAISRKRHFRSPKRKTEPTFIDLNIPQTVGKFTSETITRHKTRIFSKPSNLPICPLLGGESIHHTWPKTMESTDGFFRLARFAFPGHVLVFLIHMCLIISLLNWILMFIGAQRRFWFTRIIGQSSWTEATMISPLYS